MKFWELAENVTYTIPSGAVRPYFGAGIGVARRTFNDFFEDIVDDKANRNKVGFNVLGGAKFGGAASFFIEARGTFYSGENFPDRFIVSGGVIF